MVTNFTSSNSTHTHRRQAEKRKLKLMHNVSFMIIMYVALAFINVLQSVFTMKKF